MLDVAGGRGDLSFYLRSVHGVRCTCIDPRPPLLSRAAHRHLRRLRMAGIACDVATQDQQPEEEQESPWSLLERASCWEGAEDSADGASQQDAAQLPGAEGALLPDHILAEFDAELWHGEQGAQLQNASLVVGLHPDQVIVSSGYGMHAKGYGALCCANADATT